METCCKSHSHGTQPSQDSTKHVNKIGPAHDKTTSKNSDQPVHPSSMARISFIFMRSAIRGCAG